MNRFPFLNIGLFLATVATVWGVAASSAPPGSSVAMAAMHGLPQMAGLIAILFSHEMAHYWFARRHRVDASLPYFVPVPYPPAGTLGAFIRIRSVLPDRRAVLDIGASGPIAGFLVGLPLLFVAMADAQVVYVGSAHPNAIWQSPFTALSALIAGRPMPFFAESTPYLGGSLVTWLAARVMHGPLPPLTELQLSPLGFAAWVGMYVTMLNMLPIGQLDGGHVAYALFGRWASRVAFLVSWALFGLGIFASWTWLVWWAVIRFGIGIDHPPPASDEPLSPGRKAVAVASLVILALTFVPVPFYF